MTDSLYEVQLAKAPDETWEAAISGLPTLNGRGETINQALTVLRAAFDQWYEGQTSGAWLGTVWSKVFDGLHRNYQSEPKSALGDFYVEPNCCTSCGVPQAVAPDLIGWTEEPFVSCYWKKQPETPGELEQAFKIFDGQELGCHHYAGHDPAIQRRVGYESSDHATLLAPQTPLQHIPVTSEHWGIRVVPDVEPPAHTSFWSSLFRRNRS